MIGSLLYVTSSRPDIMFGTCMRARYQANSNEHHVSAIKRIFRYLKGTINLGLWYSKDFGFDLTAYSDADHAGCHLERKTESEYVAVSSCCAQVLWMRTQLTDYGFFYDKVSIYCDSKSAIAILCNLEPSYNQNYNDNYYPHNSLSFLCYENGGGPHATFQCQPINQNFYKSSGFDQIQPPQYPVLSEEILQAKENLMKSIQTFLKKFNRISFRETPKVLLRAWDKFFKILHAQLEDIHELLHKLLEDLKIISEELAEYINSSSWNRIAFYDDDDEHSIQYKEYLENSFNAIAPVLPTKEPEYSLSMGYEHLSTIPKMKSNEVIKSSVKNLVPIPSESEVTSDNESECDVPVYDDFTVFSNPLFDSDNDFFSRNDESFSVEDVPKENIKIYSNPLFDNEIISSKTDPHHVNVESDLIESLLNRDTLIDSSSKFDYFLEEFSGKLAHIDPIPSGFEEADFDLEEEIRLVENLFNDTLPLPENESFNFDHHDDPSFPRPPPEPPDDEILFDLEPDTGVLAAKVVEDISEHHVLMPNLFPTQPTLCPNIDTLFPLSSENEDKVFKPGILSYLLESHRDKIISDFSENPMMMYEGDILLLDVPYLHFYPP
uniref:Retrovirus-related Pol polyprotein from transposon TNT 1-94 n=1 Tax=Tanacetum cinerariifolium TaxID=118510 RepID=A0A6L2J969_TANCI|nr:hypothetical protein [Tanacetum cinerariifolium]